MQRYYRNAKLVTQLNTLVLQNLDARICPGRRRRPSSSTSASRWCATCSTSRDDDLFEREPRAMLEAFLLMAAALRNCKGMTARTLRALWRRATASTPRFRRDPDNRALFLRLFQQKRGLTHELRRMNQYDILGHYLPAFGRIVGQMQHDLFHVYTVDQHILQVMRNLRRFTMPEFAHEYPFCTRLIDRLRAPWLLYIAALFHDIAKGRGGDHSKLGMRRCAPLLPRARHRRRGRRTGRLPGRAPPDHVARGAEAGSGRSRGDPRLRRASSSTERRLTALYLLTVADIRGTSPKVWNAWKGKLLEDLFRATRALLRGDAPPQLAGVQRAPGRSAPPAAPARPARRTSSTRSGSSSTPSTSCATTPTKSPGTRARSTTGRTAPEPVVKARLNPFGDGLQVMVYVADQPELFARICGFFARLGYSHRRSQDPHHAARLRARQLRPARSGRATLPYRDMIGLIEHDLAEQLQGAAAAGAAAAGRLSRQVQHFPAHAGSRHPRRRGASIYILSVTAADRPGLLYAIARVLGEHGIDVATAKIATLGERVEDTFLISGAELGKTATLVRTRAGTAASATRLASAKVIAA